MSFGICHQNNNAVLRQPRRKARHLGCPPSIKSFGFALHKGAFKDAVALRYGWPLHLTPSRCRCGVPFDIDHVMSCRHGGFQSLRHNETRDLLAGLFAEVCSDVCVEPRLQPLSGESLPASAKKDDEARLDIRVRGFWGIRQQDAFFDVRVFYPLALSYRNSRIQTVYRQHETQKRLHYGRRVLDVQRGCFTPLVFTTGGGMAQEATACLKRLASLLSERRNEPYCTVNVSDGMAPVRHIVLSSEVELSLHSRLPQT